MEDPLKKLAALIVVAMFAMQYGCNRDNASIVKSGGSANNIGVVDPERVARALGWSEQVQKNVQAADDDARKQVDAHLAPFRATFEQTKKDIAAQAHLTSDQINTLNTKPVTRQEMQKMGMTSQQIDDLLHAGQVWQGDVQAAANIARQVLGQHNTEIQNAYREAIGPVIRRVANANGRTAIFTPNQIAYFDPTIDLTDKVVEEVQKTPTIKLVLPEMPHLEFPTNAGAAAAGPTTLPAGPILPSVTPTTAPTTRP